MLFIINDIYNCRNPYLQRVESQASLCCLVGLWVAVPLGNRPGRFVELHHVSHAGQFHMLATGPWKMGTGQFKAKERREEAILLI
jgi:hypothetical protein